MWDSQWRSTYKHKLVGLPDIYFLSGLKKRCCFILLLIYYVLSDTYEVSIALVMFLEAIYRVQVFNFGYVQVTYKFAH